MEIYLLIDGEKTGPLTVYDVCEELSSGRVEPDTKAWHMGMEAWLPLRELKPMQGMVELEIADAGPEEITISDTERETISEATFVKPRPWVRFWARSIDLGIFTTLALYLVKVTGLGDPTILSDPNQNNLGTVIAINAAWIFVESTLLFYLGTTPGKWLLKIRLRRTDGERLGLGQAYRRSISVWWRGWGLGLFPVNILAFAISHMTLNAQGKTIWDQREDLEVEHKAIGEIAFGVAAVLVLATSWATFHLIGGMEMLEEAMKQVEAKS
jgi:uncharacterized RDD family membrane protein YckC